MRKKGKAFKVLAFSLAVMIGCSNMPQIAYATDELVTETEPEVVVEEPEVIEEVNEEPVVEEQPEVIIEEVVDESVVVESSEAVVEQPEVIDEVTEDVDENTIESSETTEGETTDEEVIETTTESVETVVEEVSYTITFVDADGNELTSMEVKEVSEIVLPEAPEKEGFTFVKWDIDLEALELTEDITVTPIYEEIEVMEETVKFIITFIDAEENVISTQEVEKVEEIELPEAPIKEGYNFVNWDIDLESLELTENITIKPIYEEVETILVEKILEKTVDDKVISIIGNMTENAEIVVNKVTYTQSIEKNIEETLDSEVIVTVYEAFDIKIKVDGEEYQPNEFDESVVVSIKNIEVEEKEGEELKVFHIDDSNNIEEVVATVDTETSEAEFEADSFSVYVVAGVEYNTDNGTLLDNTYATAYLYDDGTLLVTAFKKSGTYSSYPWCSNRSNLKSVLFADNIEEVYQQAFWGASNLVKIEWNNIKTIGNKAFSECTSLKELYIPSTIKTINDYAFEDCGITELTFEDNQTEEISTIEYHAFYGCDSLKKVEINGNYSIGDNLGGFAYCDNLEELVLNCTIVNSGASATNSSIKKLIIGPNVKELKICTMMYALEECIYNCNATITGRLDIKRVSNSSNLTDQCTLVIGPEVIKIPDKFTLYATSSSDYDDITDEHSSKYTKIDMSNATSLTEIGSYGFAYLPYLTEVIWPTDESNNITIGAYAFRSCCNYINITIPDNVVSIGTKAYEPRYTYTQSDSYSSTGVMYGVSTSGKLVTTVNSNNNLAGAYDWEGSSRLVFKKITYDLNGGTRYYVTNYDSQYNYFVVDTNGSTLNCERYFKIGNKSYTPINTKYTFSNGSYVDGTVYLSADSSAIYTGTIMEKEGYVFKGWYSDAECTNEHNMESALTKDITLYAGWEEIKYEVSFNSNGGSDVEEQSVIENQKATEPTDPTRTGYTFKGWFKESTLNTEWDFDTDVVTADTTLYAKWEINKYEVSFDTDDGSAVGNQTIEHNSKAVKPTDPTKTGYDFKGWFKDSTFTTEWNFDTDTVTADTVLYAKWEIQKFTVTYKDNDGLTSESTETVEYGSQATKTNPGTVAGYDFKGWLLNGAEYDMSTPVTSNIELVAKWEIQKFAITFDSNGGSTIDSQTLDYGTTVIITAVPTRFGYSFKGWEDANGNTYSYTSGSTFSINYTVYSAMNFTAVWERNEYFVSFQTVGGSNVESQYVYEGEKIIKPADPTYGTRDFLGWYDTETLQPWDFYNDVVMHDMSLFAKWGKEKFTVSFDSDGGTTVVSQTIEDGELVVKPTGVTKTKHSLDGWYLGNTKWDFDNDVVTSNITLKAKWTYIPDKYDFSFDSNGGSSVDSQIITEGSTATKPVDPTKKGHTFKGWFTDNTFTTEYDFSDVVTGNTTVIAKWEINSYVISFNTQGGSSVADQTIKYNEKVTEPAEPTKEGYTLKGWFKDPAGIIEWNFDTDVVEEARTIFAVWEINKYTVSFNTDGGSTVENQTIEHGNKITEPAAPTKVSSVFKGWFTDNTYTTEWNFDIDTVTADTELVAKWVPAYTITFDSNGGSVVEAQNVECDTKAEKPADPTKEGYRFKVWTLNGTEFDFNTLITENITLVAEWEEIIYKTVSFVTNNNQTLENVKVEQGTKVSEPTGLEKGGFELSGWYTEAEFNNKWDFNNSINEDITLYAKWTEKAKPIVEEDEPETEDYEPESSSEEPESETETEEPTTEEPSSEEPEPSSEEPESDEPEPSSEETESESEDEPESIEPDEEPISIVEEPLLVGSVDDEVDSMKDAMARFIEGVKTVAVVVSISLLAILGILVLLLLLLAWMKRVKVMNDHNTDEYAEDKYEVVYKTSVKTEGNRLAELFKREDRVWTITIPEEIIAERVTDNFKVVLKKGFCKRYNGEQLTIVLDNADEEKVKTLGPVIDKEENEITFTYSDEQ